MGFAKEVADRFLFFDEGLIVESGTPQHFFSPQENNSSKLFLIGNFIIFLFLFLR